MAQSKDGLFGTWRGSLGNLVMYGMMGRSVARTKTLNDPKEASGAKKQAQDNFRLVMKLMQLTKPFINMGFYDAAQGRTPFHTAFSANMKLLAGATDPGGLEWLQLSQGLRAGAQQMEIIIDGSGEPSPDEAYQWAIVTWGDAQQGMPSGWKDSLMLLAINATTLDISYNLQAATRNLQQAKLRLPPALHGEKVLVFAAFYELESPGRRKDPRNVSSSQMMSMIIDLP